MSIPNQDTGSPTAEHRRPSRFLPSRLWRSAGELAVRARTLRAELGAKWSAALLTIPLALFGLLHFGPRAGLVLALSVGLCVMASILPRMLSGQPYTYFNPGTIVTGVLLGLTMSADTPIYMIVVGALVAEMLAKSAFPLLKRPLFNPAALGRGAVAVLETIDPYPIADVVTGSSPLMLTSGGHARPHFFSELLLGFTKGAIGETSRILLLIVGIPMLLWVVRKREAALALIISVPLWVAIMPSTPDIMGHAPWVLNPVVYLLGGSTLLMAFFFCTDPMTTPRTRIGGYIFGAGAGLIGVAGRLYRTEIPGWEMWGVLAMNALTPAIDHCIERYYGSPSRPLYREPPGNPTIPVKSFYEHPPELPCVVNISDLPEPLAAMRTGLPQEPFSVLRNTLKNATPADIVQEVEEGHLCGCGGAHFPVATKWQFIRRNPKPRVLIINGQEGEYESFKDHFLMTRDPHLVVEGTALSAFAIEAADVHIVIDPKAETAFQELSRAIADLKAAFSDLPFKIQLTRGPGLFVVGEETALLQYLEGKRGEPRMRPPFPAEKGLFGQPTVVQNVETVSWLPLLLNGGGKAFRQAGPLKLVSVSGAIAKPGVYAVALGTTLERILELAGGMEPGKHLQAFAVGGPSGGFLPPEAKNTPLTDADLQRAGAMLGAASIRILHAGECLLQETLKALQFLEAESCGRCTPCRVGGGVMRRLTEDLIHGPGASDFIAKSEELSAALTAGSFCGLGRGVPKRMDSLKRYWPEIIANHQQGKGCPACDTSTHRYTRQLEIALQTPQRGCQGYAEN